MNNMNTEDYIDNYNEAHIYPPNMVVVPYDEVKRMMVEYGKDLLIKASEEAYIEEIPTLSPYTLSDWQVDKQSILNIINQLK